MNVHLKTQENGYKAFKSGKSLEDNPYQHTSNKYTMQRAAWVAGWKKAKKEKENGMANP